MKLAALLLLLLFVIDAHSQSSIMTKKDSTRFKKIDRIFYTLNCPDSAESFKRVPFGRISVYDYRYDTTFLALYWETDLLKSTRRVRTQKLDLDKGMQSGLETYLNNCFAHRISDNHTSIECYVKRFSITGKDTLLENVRLNEAILDVSLEAECYYKVNDRLYPAMRIDTSFGYRAEFLKKNFSSLVASMLQPLKRKLASLDSLKLMQRKSYSVAEIQQRYRDRLNLPILTSDCKPGIYKDLKEFKSNSPSIRKFTVKRAPGKREYLVDSAGHFINPSRVFAYCHGNTLWIQYKESSGKLYRVGNCFEFLASYTRSSTFGGTATYAVLFALNLDEDFEE